jgi:subtilase family serine protease
MRIGRVAAVVAALVGGLFGIAEPHAVAAPPRVVDVCGAAPAGYARCLATIQKGAASELGGGPAGGYTPTEIKKAYGYPTRLTAGRGQTIAIVSAFDAPTIEADLGVFSAQFGLPACTTANGCFTKIYARGVAPTVDTGWALESTLDVEIVHGAAPAAKILLIEASSNNFGDLFQAVDVAHQAGARYVSNSWGALEQPSLTIFDPLLQTPGVSQFWGSGDTGAPGIFPASSPNVVAVGGTTLTLNTTTTKKSEIGWTDGGGGCSTIYDAGAVQAAFAQYPATCAGKRAFPDIAADGDGETGYAIYDSTEDGGIAGWLVVGGTSASTPLMAARAAITGVVWDAAYLYSADRKFFDVKKGNNGFPAGPGFDLVTGRGRYGA